MCRMSKEKEEAYDKRCGHSSHSIKGICIQIFLLMGAPAILQSDNGSEFTSHVITELKQMWPDLALVHGKPCHPQSQGS